MKRLALAALMVFTFSLFSQAQRQGGLAPQPPITEREFTSTDETLLRIFRAGNDALTSGHYTEAIELYDQGISKSPGLIGFWVNKAHAHMMRGTIGYNNAVNIPDEVVKRSGIEAARQDFRESVKATLKAIDLVNSIPVPTDPGAQISHETMKLATLRLRSAALGIMVTQVDESYATVAFTAFQDYINAEPDQALKHRAQLLAAQLLLIAHKFTDSYEEYQKLIDLDPDDVDALMGAGVALIDAAFITNEKNRLQQGMDYLQRFVEKAPERHRYKGSTEEVLSFLKKNPQTIINQATADTLTGARKSSSETEKPQIKVGAVNGKAVSLPKPPYPLIAKFARAEGTVVIQVLIDEEGNVTDVRVISGHPFLQAVAIEAARHAKFTPTMLSGQPVKVEGIVTYNFVAQ